MLRVVADTNIISAFNFGGAPEILLRLTTTATDDLYRTPLFGVMINSIAASFVVGDNRRCF